MAVNPDELTETERPISVLGAAAYLGMSPSALRHLLIDSGHRPRVAEDGRAYLTIPIAQADGILQERRRLADEAESLPGWSATQVAGALGIQRATVYRLHQLGALPADYRVEAVGNRKWRWNPATVRAYARRVGRTIAE